MAIAANLAGITVREVRYGNAPIIATFGRYRIGLLPISGFVKLKDSRSELLDTDCCHDAFDHQPRWKQAAVLLGGILFVLAISLALLGHEGWIAFVRGFRQIFIGALSPMSEAQHMLASFRGYLRSATFGDALGLFFAKVAAFNLLPIPILNGGDAILALLGINRASEHTHMLIKKFAIVLLLAIWGSWIIAGITYVSGDRLG